MRIPLSFVRCLSPLFVVSALSLLPPCALQGQTTSTQIDYTGSLYGYYRMEFNEPDQKHLAPVSSFLAFRKKDPSRLLLGLGDNFGPEFGASVQLENLNTADPSQGGCKLPQTVDPNTRETRPESLYKDDGRVAPRANCDNVLNFLMHAGFRAVVPGSQDFMYTAQWLRVSALLLSDAALDPNQAPAIENNDHATHLLGANLLINLKGNRCPLLFSQNPLDPNAFHCVGDGDQLEPEPLDWLTRLDRLSRQSSGSSSAVQAIQQLASDSANKAAGRQSVLDELARDEIKIFQSAWGSRLRSLDPSENDASGRYKSGAQGAFDLPGTGLLNQKVLGQALSVLNKLDLANTQEYPLNSADRDDFNTYRASLVTVLGNLNKVADPSVPADATKDQLQKILGDCSQPPAGSIGQCFVLSGDARVAAENGLLRTIATEQKNIGYTVAHVVDGSNILVVGVTGQSTMKAVSQTNLRLCPGPGKDAVNVFGACGDHSTTGEGSAVAVDPVPITEAIVRGAELLAAEQNQRPFDKIVVMAQMPHTEAEVLSERVSSLLRLDGQHYHVDVVISEAESGFGTLHVSLNYQLSATDPYSAPVVAPIPSYNSQTGAYPGRVSRLTIDSPAEFPAPPAAVQSFSLTNDPDSTFKLDEPGQGANPTTIDLLNQLMAQLQNAQKPPLINSRDQANKAEFQLLSDLEKAAHPNADVVLLQSRDVELDAMGSGYQDYSACDNETEHHELCEVRVALDRIFWKGDYLEYVAVNGKSLKSLLEESENVMAQQSQLADTGISQEWLISYGIVQSALTNITEINQENEPLWIPVDPSCMGASPGQTTYCVGGTPIQDDYYYWLVTSDQLAQDKTVYGTLESLPNVNHQKSDQYITGPLSHNVLASLHLSGPSPSASTSATTTANVVPLVPPTGTAEKAITSNNEFFQQMPLWQIDFGKVIASFNSRAPVGGNAFVGGYFQGVSDPRAYAPASQELDLELANRITGTFFRPGDAKILTPISIGEQTNFGYDRAVIGNLTGKPINAAYVQNNLTESAFLQIRLNARSKAGGAPRVWSTPRSLLVLTPLQYSVNIDTPYLFFPFTAGQVPSGELTVQLPRVSGWNERAGFREEFGSNRPKSFFMNGSYFETGMEFSTQNGNLSSITLQTVPTTGPPVQKNCPVSSKITLQTCFSSAAAGTPAKPLTINSTTTVVGTPAVETLFTPGYYWTLHFQNHLFGKNPATQINLVTDSSGDYFFGRPLSAELPTQTEYAIPLSVALVLPSKGNLTFAPTYSGFYYKAQESSQNLVVNSFSIAARWYFARDARVPLRRQIQLPGPASTDQTHTGKGH